MMNPAAGSFVFTTDLPGATVQVRMRNRMEDGVYSGWVMQEILSVDVEDVYIQNTAPTNPLVGDLWVDTSVNPTVTRAWNGTAWVISSTVGATPGNLILGSGVNAVRDPTFLDPTYWTNLVTSTNSAATTALGVTQAAMIQGDGVTTGGNTQMETASMACVGGERIQIGLSGYTQTALSGTSQASTRLIVTNRAGTTTSTTIDTFPSATGVVTNVIGNIILPDDAVSYKFRIYVNWQTGVVRTGRIYFAKPFVISLTKIGSNLILDDGRTATESDLVNSQRQYNSRYNIPMDSISDFTAFSCTLSTSNGVMRQTATAADSYFFTGPINLPGSQIPVISIRARPLSANPTFDGRIYYFTSGHGDSASYYARCPRPALTQSQWVILEFDMTKLTQGGNDWVNSTIQKIRVDLPSLAEDWEIDYIDFGSYVPAGSAIAGVTATAVAAATATISNIVLDTVLSTLEKPQLIMEVARIDASYSAKFAQAATAGVSTTQFKNRYDNLKNYLNTTIPTWNNTSVNTTIVQADFRSFFTLFYAQEEALATALDAKAGLTADWLQITGQGKTDLINQAAQSAATITDIVTDTKLSPAEKPDVIRENSRITQNWAKLSAQADTQLLNHDAIDQKYQDLQAYLEGLSPAGSWDDTSVTNVIVAADFQSKFNAYYTEEAKLAAALVNATINTAGDHMVLNASFSAPLNPDGTIPNWKRQPAYSGTVTRTTIVTDVYAAVLTGSASILANPVAVNGGDTLYWRVNYRLVKGRNGTTNASDTAQPWAMIRFYDASGTELFGQDSHVVVNLPRSPMGALQTFYGGPITVPTGARSAKAYCTLDIAPVPSTASLAQVQYGNMDFDRSAFGATVGAQSGQNLYDASGNVLNDPAIVTGIGTAQYYYGQTAWGTYNGVSPTQMANRTQYFNNSTGRFNSGFAWNTGQMFGARAPVSATISASDRGSNLGAVITIPAHTRYYVGGNVAYNAGSINVNYSTQYYVYTDDATTAGGSVTYQATTNPLILNANINRYYVGDIKTPASGGQPTDGGSGGGGRTPGECVAADSFMPLGNRARDVRIGDAVEVLDYATMSGLTEVSVTRNKLAREDCVRIVSASGIALVASKTTPITLRDGAIMLITDALNRELPVKDADGFRWERIVRVEEAGVREVSHISAHCSTYGAGEAQGAYIYTHNLPKP